jgi:hypothetical protein
MFLEVKLLPKDGKIFHNVDRSSGAMEVVGIPLPGTKLAVTKPVWRVPRRPARPPRDAGLPLNAAG